ncbi:hypothetical protein A0H81_09372 [Grifola frondosa]|uniref:Uncharacterized protein n=1 Tax=Grifola frondosa TaxID=5627 RepID=A0A1C7M2N8_GRIFR|nr:hypothetical protein A0H81_09372 [Grifola frondosa]
MKVSDIPYDASTHVSPAGFLQFARGAESTLKTNLMGNPMISAVQFFCLGRNGIASIDNDVYSGYSQFKRPTLSCQCPFTHERNRIKKAQAPSSSFGKATINFVSKFRPRHVRESMYQNRIREGDTYKAKALTSFQKCQHALPPDVRNELQYCLNLLDTTREKLVEFSDHFGSYISQFDALGKATTYKKEAIRVHEAIEKAYAFRSRDGSRSFKDLVAATHLSQLRHWKWCIPRQQVLCQRVAK